MAERSLKNAFGKILAHTGNKTNAYFRITDLLGDKPSRALDLVLSKTGQQEDFDPRATARARVAYRKFSNQLKNSLRLKTRGSSDQTQKLLLAQALKQFLGAAKGRKISKIFFDQVHNDFKQIGELYNVPETETERKERLKNEKKEEEKKLTVVKKEKTKDQVSTKKEEEKNSEPSSNKSTNEKTSEEIEAELEEIIEDIEKEQKELAEEVKEQIEEIEINPEETVSLQAEGKEDRGAFAKRITEALLQGKIKNLDDLKGIQDKNLNGLLSMIAVGVKKGGNEELANQVANQIDDPARREFTLKLIVNAKPNKEPTESAPPAAQPETKTEITSPATPEPPQVQAPPQSSPEISGQINSIKNQIKKPDGGEIDDQTADQIRNKIDGWNRQDGQDHFQNPEKIKQAAQQVEIENGQNKQVQDSLQKRGISIPPGMADEIRKKIDEWNRVDGKDHFQDENQINEAYNQVAPNYKPEAAPIQTPPIPPKTSSPTPEVSTPPETATPPSKPEPQPEPAKLPNTPPPLPKEALSPNKNLPPETPESARQPVPQTVENGEKQTSNPEEAFGDLPFEDETESATDKGDTGGEPALQLPTEKVGTTSAESTTPPLIPPEKQSSDLLASSIPTNSDSQEYEGNKAPATISPEEQPEIGSDLDASKGVDGKKKEEGSNEDETTASPPDETGSDQENNEEEGDPELNGAKRGINKVARPFKAFMNFGKLQQLNRQIKEIDQQIAKKKKSLKREKRIILITRLRGAFGQCCCVWWTLVGPLVIAVLFLISLLVKWSNSDTEKITKEIKALEEKKDVIFKQRENLLSVFKAYNLQEQAEAQQAGQDSQG